MKKQTVTRVYGVRERQDRVRLERMQVPDTLLGVEPSMVYSRCNKTALKISSELQSDLLRYFLTFDMGGAIEFIGQLQASKVQCRLEKM